MLVIFFFNIFNTEFLAFSKLDFDKIGLLLFLDYKVRHFSDDVLNIVVNAFDEFHDGRDGVFHAVAIDVKAHLEKELFDKGFSDTTFDHVIVAVLLVVVR